MTPRKSTTVRKSTPTVDALEPRLLLAAQPVKAVDMTSGVDVNGTLFFVSGTQLWKSDGTDAGTVLVKTVGSDVRSLTNANGTLYFVADYDLWRSDGTAAGTVVVANHPGPSFDEDGYPLGSYVSSVAHANGGVFYTVVSYDLDDTYDTLYRLDTGQAIASKRGDIGSFIPVGQSIYFTMSSYEGIATLMKSDGTAAGTVSVVPLDSAQGYSGQLIDIGGAFFYWVYWGTGYPSVSLWKTDGTAAGTGQVKLINDRSDEATSGGCAANGILFFAADDGTGSGMELWRSDGTEAGTVRLKDINPGAGDSRPADLVNVNGTIYFTANDGAGGRELWRSDGTEAGTVRVINLNGAAASTPHGLTNVNGTLFFGALDGGQKLLKLDTVLRVDGTAARDVIVASVNGENLEIRNNGQLIKSAPFAETTMLVIAAGDGDDVIDCSQLTIPVFVSAGGGNDKVASGSAPDTIGGGAGKDTIDGGLGNDRLNGHGGHDRLFGNAGADRLYGYDGNDLLDGSSSNDRMYGGNGADTMFGAGGNDRFFAAGDESVDELFGGKGHDTAIVDALDILASVETSS
jgi:ELWxxDGT repeat protein